MVSAARLAALWFGVQALWGALLGISLQARSSALHPHDTLIAYGQIATAGALTAMLVQVFVGIISDRRRHAGGDRRPFLVVGTLCGILGVLAFYLAPTFGALIGAMIFLQFGVNIAIGPYQAIIPDYFSSRDTGVASSWMAAFQSGGNACGALAATLIATPLGVAIVLALFLAGGALVTIVHMTEIYPRAIESGKVNVPTSAVDLFISRAILWIGFYTILGYMFFYIRDTLQIATAARTTGVVILIFTVAAALGAALSGRPADRFDRRLIVNAGTALLTAALIIFIVLRDAHALFVTAAFAGLGWGAFLTADWALGCAILPRSAMATAMGVWNIAVAGSQIVAPALATGVLLVVRPPSVHAPLYALGMAAVEVVIGSAWIWRLPSFKSAGAG